MKGLAIRTIAMGAICASFMGATSIASAADWQDRGHDRVVRHDDTGLAIGIGLGLLGAAILLNRPHHRDCDDYVYRQPVIERPVVIERDRWDNGRWHDRDRDRFDRDGRGRFDRDDRGRSARHDNGRWH